jgi:hypothetical protein
MTREPPPRIRLLALSALGAVGLALVILSLGGTTGWLLIALGCAAVAVSVPGIYVLQRPELERAARAVGRGRAISLRRDEHGR